jgi:prepilin-type processing-associated H-X9-DG protein
LVVIVIILSITALMFPAINNARNSAKAAACSANQARILSAMAAYESIDESFPYGLEFHPEPPPGTGNFPGNASYDPIGWWWFHFIDVYSGGSPYKPSVVKCPAKRFAARSFQTNILWGNYGVNLSICRWFSKTQKTEFKGRTTLSRSEIKGADSTMLLADSGYAIIKWHHATQNPPVALSNQIWDTGAYIPGLSINSQRPIFSGMEKDAIEGRHPGKTINVGFVDGHVERTQAEDLLVDSKGDPAGDSDVLWKAK